MKRQAVHSLPGGGTGGGFTLQQARVEHFKLLQREMKQEMKRDEGMI